MHRLRLRHAQNAHGMPTLDDFAAMGRKAYDDLPAPFHGAIGDVTVGVADLPEDDVLAELGLSSPYELLGLFTGIGIAQDGGTSYTGRQPNRIWLYRLPILAYWAENDDTLQAIVSHVLIHEIGHHFGLSDDDMERIEAEAG